MSIYQIVSDRKEPTYAVRSPKDAFKALERYKNKRNEHFFVITLNGAHEVIAVRIVSIGLLNRTVVYPFFNKYLSLFIIVCCSIVSVALCCYKCYVCLLAKHIFKE
jgi:hypothetical protein